MVKRALAFIAALIFLSWFEVSTAVSAAEQPQAVPQAGEIKQAPPAPVAIPASEIVPRAEQTLRSLQDTRFQIAADSEAVLNSIEKEIAAFAEKSNRRWQGIAEMIRGMRSLQRLNDVLREWSLEQSQLDNWDRALAARSQILGGQEKEISQIVDIWEITRAAGQKLAMPKAALQKIAEVLRAADAVRGLIRKDMAKLLNLQVQLAARRESLAKVRADIDKAREELGRMLFVLDSSPLWEAFVYSEARDQIVIQSIQSSQRFGEDLQEFIKTYRDRILVHLILFLVMVLLFRFLRRGLTPEAVERVGGPSALFVLDRLFSAAILLALTAFPLIYPSAAASLLRVALLPTVIPVLRLLPRLLPKTFRHWVYMLVVMYGFEFLRYLLPVGSLLSRLLLLIIAAGGCLGLGWFLRLHTRELSISGYRERLILQTVRFVCFFFGVSVVSNFVGNVTLAEILVATPIRITYAAALIFVGAHLLMTLIVIALQSRPARSLRSAREHGELIAMRCRVLIRFVAVFFWSVVSLYIVGVLGDVSAAGREFLQLRWKVGAAEISIQDLAAFLAVLFTAVIVSRMLRFLLTEEILPRIRLPRGVPGAVDVLARYGVLLIGFFIALAAAGVDLSKVTLLVSALGVGIGFGLQNVVNNFVSGLILVFEHPVQVGDLVEVGTTFGEIRKIGFRASVLRTPDGADVIIPNSELVGARFVNWSLSDWLRRISIPVNVAYGTDPERVIEILIGVARKHASVLAEPAPMAVFDRFGDSALNFTLFCWSFVDRVFQTRSELTIAINSAFKEGGIEIPFPQQDVHVHWQDSGNSGVSAEPQGGATPRKTLKPAALLSAERPLPKK